MRHAPLVCLLLALTLATVSMAGDIQVTCEPGLRVFLDNQLAGTSSASEHGLHLTKVDEYDDAATTPSSNRSERRLEPS